jgi:hypothetical protein
LSITIVYHANQKLVHHGVAIINPQIAMITLIAAGTISLHGVFGVSDIAKKYELISLNLDAKNSIKNGRTSFIGFCSVLDGYFGIPYGLCMEISKTNRPYFFCTGLYCL